MSQSERTKVLVVDDDKRVYTMICDFLSVSRLTDSTSFDVDWAATYAAALEKMCPPEHDVCLIDYYLGDHNGVDLMREAIADGCTMPMILLTSQGDYEIDIEAMQAGAFDYLEKTELTPATLEHAIRYAIRHSQTLKALHASEERYRDLFENANDLIQSVGADGRFIYVNQRWLDALGYTADEAQELHFEDILRPDQVPHCRETFRRLGQGESLVEPEIVFMTKTGDELIVEGNLNARLVDGQFVSTRGIFRDITERKQAEEQLRELSRAVEQSPGTVVITDTAGNIEYVNPQFTQLTGYTFDEAIGQNPRILKSGATPPDTYVQLWDTITAGDVWQGEFINKKKNGEIYWEFAVISPIKDPTGATTHFVAIKEDITARKQAEEALQKAHDRLSMLAQIDVELVLNLDIEYVLAMALDDAMRLSAADAGFIGLVDNGTFRIVTAAGPYSLDVMNAVIPAEASVIMQAGHRQEAVLRTDVDASPKRVLALPTTRAQIVIPLVSREHLIGIFNLETKDPERFTPEVFEFIKLIASRAAIAIDNAQMYENRALLIQDLDAFAHTVAHDLKNPLAALALVAGTLERYFDRMPAEKRQSRLERIVQSAHKMTSIIDSLLLLASVRQMDKVPAEPMDMALVMDEIQQRLKHMIQEYQAEVILPDTWPAATGYVPWVEEVWANYISNALKYGGQPPRVTLGADVQDRMVRFWVRDNGPGLTPEEQAQLFTPFTRLSQAHVKGHGLGLSIVHRIVEKLGGEVGVESEVGVGSVFSFTLPGVVS